MFDIDQDGILNLIEAQHVLMCIGFRANREQVNFDELQTKRERAKYAAM